MFWGHLFKRSIAFNFWTFPLTFCCTFETESKRKFPPKGVQKKNNRQVFQTCPTLPNLKKSTGTIKPLHIPLNVSPMSQYFFTTRVYCNTQSICPLSAWIMYSIGICKIYHIKVSLTVPEVPWTARFSCRVPTTINNTITRNTGIFHDPAIDAERTHYITIKTG